MPIPFWALQVFVRVCPAGYDGLPSGLAHEDILGDLDTNSEKTHNLLIEMSGWFIVIVTLRKCISIGSERRGDRVVLGKPLRYLIGSQPCVLIAGELEYELPTQSFYAKQTH
jgi:hypothetical protein